MELDKHLHDALKELKSRRKGMKAAEDMYNRLIMHQNDAMVFLLNTLGDIKAQVAHNQALVNSTKEDSKDVSLGEFDKEQRFIVLRFFCKHLQELISARNSMGELKSASDSISLPPIVMEHSLFDVSESATAMKSNLSMSRSMSDILNTSALDQLATQIGTKKTIPCKNAGTQTLSLVSPLHQQQNPGAQAPKSDVFSFNPSRSISGGPSYTFNASNKDGWRKSTYTHTLNPRGPKAFLKRRGGYGNRWSNSNRK